VNSGKARGISLVQVVFALFLTGVFMAITARLFSGYSTYMRHAQVKDHQFEVARHALAMLTRELSESLQTTIAPNRVTISKRDPSKLLPPPPASPAGIRLDYDPKVASQRYQLNVRYELDARELKRTTGSLFTPGGVQTQVLATDLDGFSVTQTGRRYQVVITLIQKQRVVVLQDEAYHWRDVP
jgi:hypothetical protein